MAHDGRYTPIEIVPTVNKNTTEYAAEGEWVDCDHIRFRDKRIQKMGGWVKRGDNLVFTGVARDIKVFSELTGQQHIAVGTHQKLMIEENDEKFDITPIETVTSGTNNISVSAGSSIVTVSSPSHDRAIGDYVIFSSVQDVSVAGVDLRGNEYIVTSTISADAFQITATQTAVSTRISDGGTVKMSFLLKSGRKSNGTANGWGVGTWNTPGAQPSWGWGLPRSETTPLAVALRQWSLDNWGEDLVACRRGGNTYIWDATVGVSTRASAIGGYPASTNVVFVHPNRHVVLLGTVPVGGSALDPLEIRWSDRDNLYELAASATTLAGSFRLQGGNEIIGYTKSKREVVVFTDSSVWSMTALPNDLVFGFQVLSNNAGLISQHAAVDIDGITFWMSNSKEFYFYDGRVQKLQCSVRDFIFGDGGSVQADIEFAQKEKTFCGINTQFNEILWLYQSVNSTTDDCDRYVKYNYIENAWDVGTLDRVVWADSYIPTQPVGVSESGQAYDHEVGQDADGVPLKSYAESSFFDIEDGTEMLLVDQMIPDFIQTQPINFTVTTRKWPNGPTVTKGPYQVPESMQVLSLRARGREGSIRISTSATNGYWEMGKPRLRVKTDGER